jgi:pSer/pThr/pTyr-binding forkhead associated (FHA) protein
MSGPILLILRILLIVVLYAFLGFALYILWRDLKRHAELAAARQSPALTLQVVGQADQPPQDLASRTFHQPEIVMGRGPACDLPLDDKTVSTRHARLTYHHSQWWLEDLGSTNGTYLNNEQIDAPVIVVPGDELRLGQVGVRLES